MKLLFLGDPQRTMLIERLLGREQNDTERRELFKNLARHCEIECPEAVLFLGDLVAVGSSFFDWNHLNRLLQPLRARDIPLFTAMGNHDYFGIKPWCLAKVRHGFPTFPRDRTWYVQRFQSVAVVFLDSNFYKLTAEEWTAQQKWYKKTIRELDSDSSIQHVLTISHHLPYTNSQYIRDSIRVQDAFVSTFEAAAKTRAMLCGHVHGYERFEKNKKTYIVSAGGGGPRGRLRDENQRLHAGSFYYRNGHERMPLHFLEMHVDGTVLKFMMRGWENGQEVPLDTFEIR